MNVIVWAKDHPYETGGGVFVLGLILVLAWRHFHSASAPLDPATQIKLAQIQAQAEEVAARAAAQPGIAQANAQSASARANADAATREALYAERGQVATGAQSTSLGIKQAWDSLLGIQSTNNDNLKLGLNQDQEAIRQAQIQAEQAATLGRYNLESSIYGDRTGYETTIAQLPYEEQQLSDQQKLSTDQLGLQAVENGNYATGYAILGDPQLYPYI